MHVNIMAWPHNGGGTYFTCSRMGCENCVHVGGGGGHENFTITEYFNLPIAVIVDNSLILAAENKELRKRSRYMCSPHYKLFI